ncbi:hypothetical protein IscW_ISCW004073 [Ixodes scapularis]|uniref:PDZ domain-containing protein n=1 Tax=Ixodes scapularis TaxID=6945 RepID=B7PK02_IXOSC|nr:hypothetical protein IscW_ISCW004073 [Ixodes scapularis]|eukprot:XP_002408984.1 hypothetical protein IscW_ISCW004073 [Ixodes scapularis]
MGLSVRFASGHAVVTHVQEGSIAAEDDQVQVGDVLDELYGEAINGRKRGAISALLSHFEGLPVYASFVKVRSSLQIAGRWLRHGHRVSIFNAFNIRGL